MQPSNEPIDNPIYHIPMLTFVTMYVIRLYYPRWKEFFSFYFDSSRRNNYGRWAMRQSWKGEKQYSLSYS